MQKFKPSALSDDDDRRRGGGRMAAELVKRCGGVEDRGGARGGVSPADGGARRTSDER